MIEEIYDILFRFGGGKGGEPGNVAVRFLLPTFFWAVLAWVAYREWKIDRQRKDLYVGIAAFLGMIRELMMFAAEYGSWRGRISFELMYNYYPPFEHAATMISCLFIGAAFLMYLRVSEKFVKAFFFTGTAITGLLYVVTAPTWQNLLRDKPNVSFGLFWGDMAFRTAASTFMGTVVAALLNLSQQGQFIPRTLIVGFTFFFLDEFLMIFNIASNERYVQYFAPLRHNLHIWAIPLFIAFYWTDLRSRMSAAKQIISNSFMLSPSMLCVFDHEGIIQAASPASGGIVGAQPEQLAGHNISNCFMFEGNTGLLQSLKDKDSFEGEFRLKDGSVRHLSWNVNRSSDDGYFYAAVSDRTRLKLAEDALNEALGSAWNEKAKTESILSTIEDGVSIHDRDFRIILQNRKCRQLLGEHTGKFCYDAYARQKRICVGCPMMESFKDGGIHVSERQMAVSGGRRFFRMTVAPLRDKNGGIIGGVKVLRDIEKEKSFCISGNMAECSSETADGSRYSTDSGLPDGQTQVLFSEADFRVLVMDDEDSVREVAVEMLESAGYSVVSVSDGKAAVELYKQSLEEGHPFDAVILDLTVPGGMGGRETVEKLIEADPDVLAIVSSGYSEDAVMSDHKAYGFFGNVPKPYHPEDLRNAVLSAILKRRKKSNEA